MLNSAVQFENPAHAHAGTTESAFTVASNEADTTRLTADGIERVGAADDLPLQLAAKGKGPINASGGPLLLGVGNAASGGASPHVYTADPTNNPSRLILSGGDFTAEFAGGAVCYTDGDRCVFDSGFPTYNAALNQTTLDLMGGTTSAAGYATIVTTNGVAIGFANMIAGDSAALGMGCIAAGVNTFAVGRKCWAFGNEAFAAGNNASAFGYNAFAVGGGTAAGWGNCSFGGGVAGAAASYVLSVVDQTVTVSDDVRTIFGNNSTVLLFNSAGEHLDATVASDPVFSNYTTSFRINVQPTFQPEYIVNTSNTMFAMAESGSQATGNYAHAEGCNAIASNYYAHCEGFSTTASGQASHAEGFYTTASGQESHAEGIYTTASALAAHSEGRFAAANKQCQRALASGQFAETGDAQYTEIVLRRATTDAAPAELTLDGYAPSGTTENTSNRFICATGKTYACLIMIAARKSDGASAFFVRQVLIKNVDGTVSLEGSVQTVGVDINPSAWTTPTIEADNTNKSLAITVTGVASANIRWAATLHAQEIKY